MDNIIQELKYINDKITILLNDNNIWFNGYQISKILGYKRPKDSIKNLINKKHIKYLKDIFKDYKLYPNAQPNSLFLNEAGLYTLLIRSNKPNAEKFFLWVVEDVLPSIRKTGIYSANKKILKQIEEQNKIIEDKNKELKEEKLKILALENNQKNRHICNNGTYIYILKSSLNNYINEDEPDILKIGKTKKYKIRMGTYNTGLKDNAIILYRVKVNDISAIENCLKGLFSKKVYRSYKEYFNITLGEAIKTIKKCIKLTGTTKISEDKFYLNFKLKRSNPLNGFKININNDCNNYKQTGGYQYTEIKSYKFYHKMYRFFYNVMSIIKNN